MNFLKYCMVGLFRTSILRLFACALFFLAAQEECRAVPDISQMSYSFKEFARLVDSKDISLINHLHPRSLKAFRTVLLNHIRRRLIDNERFLEVTGLPGDYENLSDHEFARTVLSEFAKAFPTELSFPAWKAIRVIGVLQDGEDFVLVYKLPSSIGDLTEPATVTYGVHEGETKIASVFFVKKIITSWDKTSALKQKQ